MAEEPVYTCANQYHTVGTSDPVDARERSLREFTMPAKLLRRWTGLFRKTAAASAPAGTAAFDGTAGALLDALSDWVCGLDATGRITYANAALMRAQGCVPGALTGMLFVDLMPPAAADAVRLALQRATATDEPQTCQHETQVAGGESWRQWTFQRIPENAPAELSGTYLLATGRDITEQKRLEHQFLHAQRVGSIGMLASGIAHDLNNVLAPITMSADLLILRGCSAENRALLDMVATSAARGAGLVNQMLSFTRGLDGNREIVDLGKLVKELSRFISRTFAKNIEVRMVIAPELWRLHANPTQIYQVLLNLCVNARDAMPHGGTITIAASNVTLDEVAAAAQPGAVPGSYAVLGVSDTGTGIPPEIVNRIFDPFFTTKPIGEGTGLGLSTVRSIMKACGGFVTLATQVGQGTTFRAHFPVMDTAVQTPATNPGLEITRGAGEHVLVVDDEEFFRDVTRRLLEDFGYVVHVAADGAEAVRVFEQHRADIVVALVDFDMPVMDGPTAIKAMKALKPHLHIITVSGSGSSSAHPQPPEAELQLTKPYPMGALLQSLRQVLYQPAAV